ncbi:MAG: nuclease [Rhodocyclaceae bacterium]|nr:nuclease [Rhodocyclaceae bacterium]
MAKVYPTRWRQMQGSGALRRELETLALLAENLPDSYTVYHGVHWNRVERRESVFGEIDFAIVSPAGRVVLLEQKSGFLEETSDGLVKRYGDSGNKGGKSVVVQLARNADALKTKLTPLAQGQRIPVDVLLFCPDYQVKNPAIAGLDPARLIDSSRRQQLVQVITDIAPADEGESPLRGRIHKFFTDALELVPDVGAMASETRSAYTRLSGGLAAWARRIECEPFRLRVVGTAGSGKTQLALAVFRAALEAGRRPLYVCYNRPLGDHFAALAAEFVPQEAPVQGVVATYHQLCDRILTDLGERPDFSRPNAFRTLEQRFLDVTPGDAWRFDELIVDEGQDFAAEWRDALLRLLTPEGRAWWLEDPMQNLYDRPPIPLPGWVVLRSDTNYRSPATILATLNRLLPEARRIDAGGIADDAEVEVLTYTDQADLLDKTKRALTHSRTLGFKKEMVAVVSFRGRDKSLLSNLNQLGPHSLKRFTGTYDLFGNPVFDEGDTLVESVYRFKGQSAPCVIFTEIDFEQLDEAALRKLFVGATRATMKLFLVLSEHAAATLLQQDTV